MWQLLDECESTSLEFFTLHTLAQATLERVGVRGNTSDMDVQPFYRFIEKTYVWHVVASFVALFLAGGLPAVVWGGALRAVWVYHVTWFVNSASHVWGYQVRSSGPIFHGVLIRVLRVLQVSMYGVIRYGGLNHRRNVLGSCSYIMLRLRGPQM